MVLADHFKYEDIVRLRNEFKEGLFELDISNNQAIWLAGICYDFDKLGMQTPCTDKSVGFLKNMMDRLNEVSQ